MLGYKRYFLIVVLCAICVISKAQDALDSAAVVQQLSQAQDLRLYYEVFKWYHTCYRYGGNTDHGIDCSHFVNMLYEKLYGKTLGPSAGAILTQCKLLKKGLADVQEGDIVFFKIKKGQISHVGIYLQNNKFAHASVHSGVVISDMDEPYYKKRFYKAGRVVTQ